MGILNGEPRRKFFFQLQLAFGEKNEKNKVQPTQVASDELWSFLYNPDMPRRQYQPAFRSVSRRTAWMAVTAVRRGGQRRSEGGGEEEKKKEYAAERRFLRGGPGVLSQLHILITYFILYGPP